MGLVVWDEESGGGGVVVAEEEVIDALTVEVEKGGSG